MKVIIEIERIGNYCINTAEWVKNGLQCPLGLPVRCKMYVKFVEELEFYY